ncbi:hypothetical protein MKEN_01081600 [Mycena kentingensis (nom. inval.)]|nr:hypothetical protein MKEN_01081600 [Mycena kentingensis (nom. inval.)]
MHLRLLLVLSGFAAAVAAAKTKAVVLFGDSFTDQSRAHSIANGTFPGKDYQAVFPPADFAADGGVQWSWYLGLYANYTIWNYAVGGAVCSNKLTPLFAVPDVIGGQSDWFVQDHVSHHTLDMDPQEFVTLHNLHAFGARRFIINLVIPLELTRLYAPTSDPTIYFPAPHNGTQWNKRMFNFVHTMNAMLRGGVLALREEWKGTGATVQTFDTYRFFMKMYENPDHFFNGTAPANATGHCHQCPDPDDFQKCGM